MNTVSKPVQNAPKSSTSLGNLPERKIRAGAISATVWLNKSQKPTGEESEYRTISLERSYKDQGGEWKSSNSLRISDVPKAIAALQKAYETIVLNEQDLFKHQNSDGILTVIKNPSERFLTGGY